jgi:hypothetical protein
MLGGETSRDFGGMDGQCVALDDVNESQKIPFGAQQQRLSP